MKVRATSLVFALASIAAFVGCVAGAWATFDFWETFPLVPCVAGTGVLAALALYAHRGRVLGALALGVTVTVLTFLATALVTLARWEG